MCLSKQVWRVKNSAWVFEVAQGFCEAKGKLLILSVKAHVFSGEKSLQNHFFEMTNGPGATRSFGDKKEGQGRRWLGVWRPLL